MKWLIRHSRHKMLAMKTIPRRHLLKLVVVIGLFTAAAPSFRAAESLPAKLSDEAFWKMVTDFSEEGGYFRFENFLSNELGFQYVIPRLNELTKTGGVYMGVGPEQNFTYIVAIEPKIA